MKTRITMATIGILITIGVAQGILAQCKTRELYVRRKAPGLELRVLKVKDGKDSLVDASDIFKAGDSIRLEFRSNFGGYVYFVNIAPSGVAKVKYKDKVREGELNIEPGGGEFVLDQEVGTRYSGWLCHAIRFKFWRRRSVRVTVF